MSYLAMIVINWPETSKERTSSFLESRDMQHRVAFERVIGNERV